MPTVQYGHHQVHYELTGEAGRPVITFLNGLTQNANLWKSYAEYFVPRGYRVLAYDMLGQGRSSKPVIDIKLAMHADLLDSLLEQLEIEKTHLFLAQYPDESNYRRAITLSRLARSLSAAGNTADAEALADKALEQTSALPRDQKVLHLLSICHTELADILRGRGRYREAREHYEHSLAIHNEIDDTRNRAVVFGQLGSLALAEGDFREAMRRYQDALTAFDNLGERNNVATCHNQLGLILQTQGHWEAAERHYRQAAELKIHLSNEAGAAETWCNLANVCWRQGRNAQAEQWYRQALAVMEKAGHAVNESTIRNNLAALLSEDPTRLDEAQREAERALSLRRTLHPGVSEIWNTLMRFASTCWIPSRLWRSRRSIQKVSASETSRVSRFCPTDGLSPAASTIPATGLPS